MNKLSLPCYIAAIYARPRFLRMLRLLSGALVVLTVLGFLGVISYVALKSVICAFLAAVLCGVPFIAVTVLRVWIDAERPYETYDFGKYATFCTKQGRSMPSRHVFSAFIIGTLGCFVHLPLGICILLFGALIAFLRVLLGVHFVRDVLVGAVVGVVSGIIGGAIINYCLH